MSQNGQAQNGKTVVTKLPTVTKAETSKTAETEKNPVVVATVKAEQENTIARLLNPSAEQRLKSLEQMRILGEKYSFLKEKEDELNKFSLSSDGTQERIRLSNASGFKFEVSNSQTIEKVLAVISEDLKVFTSRAEEEILKFTV